MCWRSYQRIVVVRENPQFQVSGSIYSLEGQFFHISLHSRFDSLLLCKIRQKDAMVLFFTDCYYFVFQCFLACLVHVQSGNQFCNYWATNFGKSSQVTPIFSCDLWFLTTIGTLQIYNCIQAVQVFSFSNWKGQPTQHLRLVVF